MQVTSNEFWTLIHGMTLGAIFLLAFSGSIAELYALRPEWETNVGMSKAARRDVDSRYRRMGAVFTGAFLVYPWYRAAAPKGVTDLAMFPKFFLLANEATAG